MPRFRGGFALTETQFLDHIILKWFAGVFRKIPRKLVFIPCCVGVMGSEAEREAQRAEVGRMGGRRRPECPLLFCISGLLGRTESPRSVLWLEAWNCSRALERSGECFQGGGLDGGFVQVMEPGFIVNPPDRFRQTGRNTGGEIMKDDKRLAGLRRLRQLLKEAVNLPFPGGKPQNQ